MDNTSIRKKKSFWAVIWNMYCSEILFTLTILAIFVGFVGLVLLNDHFICHDIYFAIIYAIIEIAVIVAFWLIITNVTFNICIIKRFTYLPITEDELKESEIFAEKSDDLTIANWWYFLLNNIPVNDSKVWDSISDRIETEFFEMVRTIEKIGHSHLHSSIREQPLHFTGTNIKKLIKEIDSAGCKEEAIKKLTQNWHVILRGFD